MKRTDLLPLAITVSFFVVLIVLSLFVVEVWEGFVEALRLIASGDQSPSYQRGDDTLGLFLTENLLQFLQAYLTFSLD